MIYWSHIMNCAAEATAYFSTRNIHATYQQLAKFCDSYMSLHWPMAGLDRMDLEAVSFRQSVRSIHYGMRKS